MCGVRISSPTKCSDWPPETRQPLSLGTRAYRQIESCNTAVLVVFSLQLRGFNNQQMRALLAQLLGLDPANYPVGKMTYDLRRLRLHGIIERFPTAIGINSHPTVCGPHFFFPKP